MVCFRVKVRCELLFCFGCYWLSKIWIALASVQFRQSFLHMVRQDLVLTTSISSVVPKFWVHCSERRNETSLKFVGLFVSEVIHHDEEIERIGSVFTEGTVEMVH